MSTDDLRLTPEALRRVCSIDHFDFETTAELPAQRDIIGQPRGVRAIEFGIDIDSHGYNIYVLGPSGTGRTTAIERFLRERAATRSVPGDWVYVQNFETPHKPRAIDLPAGRGRELRDQMATFIEDLRREIPRALDTDEFSEAMDSLWHDFEESRDALIKTVRDEAEPNNFGIGRTPVGLMVLPVIEGQLAPPETIGSLPPEQREAMETKRHELQHKLDEALKEIHQAEREVKASMRELETKAISNVLDLHLDEVKEAFAESEETLLWLGEVRTDILDNPDNFKNGPEDNEPAEEDGPTVPPQLARLQEERRFRRYQVNLIVDHSKSEGAPVIVEDLPTYQNLIGRLEAEVQFGAMTTDFTMIRAGALHLANGGYLVLRAIDLLRHPFAWEGLKRILNSGEIRIEDPESRTGAGVMSPQTPEPEPIPIDVKVVLLGSSELYYKLFSIEEDFPQLFKVKADFDHTMERNHDNEHAYATFIASRCHEDKLPHFNPAAVGQIVEFGSWLATDQDKLSTRFGDITDLVVEAAYQARKAGNEVVTADDVQQALVERIYRANEPEQYTQERILTGKVFIDTEGAIVGQVNGLSVMTLGDYMFGQPNRVTARVFVGAEGVVNIEREVGTSGPIHAKGVLTLHGYLGGQYASNMPLSLSASITFEQNYGGIEGDSAASTELYALLSALSGFPLRQDIAVTGSVNQLGQVQPIGGATEKIEGFFDICRERGLTGTQGVMVPASNVKNLMLSPEVVEAVAAGQFHVYAVSTIDEGIEILTGVPAGERNADGTYADGTVHHAAQNRLHQLVEELERYAGYRTT